MRLCEAEVVGSVEGELSRTLSRFAGSGGTGTRDSWRGRSVARAT